MNSGQVQVRKLSPVLLSLAGLCLLSSSPVLAQGIFDKLKQTVKQGINSALDSTLGPASNGAAPSSGTAYPQASSAPSYPNSLTPQTTDPYPSSAYSPDWPTGGALPPPGTPVPTETAAGNKVLNSIFDKVTKKIGVPSSSGTGYGGASASPSNLPVAPSGSVGTGYPGSGSPYPSSASSYPSSASPGYPSAGAYPSNTGPGSGGAPSIYDAPGTQPNFSTNAGPAISPAQQSATVGGVEMYSITAAPGIASTDISFSGYAAGPTQAMTPGLNRSHKKLGGMYYSKQNIETWKKQHGQ